MNNASLNQIVNKLLAFGHGHKYIKTVAHGQLDEMDLTSRITYPLMHIVPQDITPSGGRLQFSFDIVFADMPRMKSDKPENVLEIQSDMEQIARDLYTEIKNGGVLFGDMTEVGDDWSALPFQDEYHNYLSGVTLSINIIVASNWNACEIPADWVNGTGADIPQFGRDLTIAVYDEGVFRVNAREVNFIGSGVSVAADGNRANVTITGGGGGGGLTCEDLPECQTIIDIEESIEAVEIAVASKVDSVTGNIVDNTDPLNPVVDQVQANWNESDSNAVSFIQNKPTIPDVPSTIVESVQEGDDIVVDATDPANPIVGVVPNTFLRLSGTEEGFPVIGGADRSPAGNVDGIFWDKNLNSVNEFGAFTSILWSDGGEISLYARHDDGTVSQFYVTNSSVTPFTVTSSNSNFQGIQAPNLNEANYSLLSLIKFSTLKSRLWNGTTDPTVDDDAGEGFIGGRSLWLNTATGVLWKCEDASTGAADWQVYYDPSKNKSYEFFSCSTAIGLTFPASSTRFFAVTGILANNTITNSAFAATRIGAAGKLVGLQVVTTTTQPASGSQTWEIFYGTNPASMSGTGIQVVIAAGSAAGSYVTTTEFDLAAGEYIAFRQVNAATAASAQLAVISTTFEINNI